MRRLKLLTALLLLAGITLAAAGKPAQTGESIETFWQKFKTAVMSGNKGAVAALASFPLEMSYGIPKIRSRAEFRRRYRQVFNEQTDAQKCFSTAQPEKDPARPKEFKVACPDAAGNEVVIYIFAKTKAGWKFVGLDNINE